MPISNSKQSAEQTGTVCFLKGKVKGCRLAAAGPKARQHYPKQPLHFIQDWKDFSLLKIVRLELGMVWQLPYPTDGPGMRSLFK